MWYKKANQTVWIIENGVAVPKNYNEIVKLIKNGNLTQSSLVWQSSMAGWQKISTVPSLNALFPQGKTPSIAPQQTAPKITPKYKQPVESDFAQKFQVGDRVVFGNFDIENPKNWQALEKLLYDRQDIITEMFTVEMSDSYDYRGKVLRWDSYKNRTTKIDKILKSSRTQYVILPKLDTFVKKGSKIWIYFGSRNVYPCLIINTGDPLKLIELSTARGLEGPSDRALFECSIGTKNAQLEK